MSTADLKIAEDEKSRDGPLEKNKTTKTKNAREGD